MTLTERLSQPRFARLVLALAMAASAGLTLWLLRGTTFTIDEMGYLVQRRGWDAETLLEPHNGHLILTNLLIVKLTLEAFGSSHLPMTLLAVAAQLTVGGLVFALAQRRVGPLGALFPAVLVLFFGAGWEVMMSPSGLSNQLALISGLAMLLCLQRRDRAGDVAAALFLLLALASHTLGLAFAVGAAVEILLVRGTRGWRGLWIVAAPVALYACWWLWAAHFDQTQTSGYAIGSLASGVYDQLAAICASITGIFRQPGSPDTVTALTEVRGDRGTALVLVLIAAVVLRVRLGPRVGARTWTMLAIVTAYLLLVGLGLRDGRPPAASRYLYTGSVLVLLLIVQLCDGLRITRGWAIAAASLTAISLLGNVAQMKTAGEFFRSESSYNRAEMAALDLGRDCIPASYEAETRVETILPHRDMVFSAGEYLAMTDALGSPAYSADELANAPPAAREAAETVFRESLGREVPIEGSISAARVCARPTP